MRAVSNSTWQWRSCILSAQAYSSKAANAISSVRLSSSNNCSNSTLTKMQMTRSTFRGDHQEQSSVQYHPHSVQNCATLSPRDNQNGSGATAPNVGSSTKAVWRGKPVIFDSERSSRAPLPHCIPDGMDESLQFESRFESGNLRQVRRM